MKYSNKYVPRNMSKSNKSKLISELNKSRKLYKKNKFYTRKKIKGYNNKTSKWNNKLRNLYNIDKDTRLSLNLLSKKSKCSKKSLKKIINKGKGAYFSSGSRPNQTPYSWGIARLYSALSGGPASKVDIKQLKNGCDKSSKSLKLAQKQVGGIRMKEKILKFNKSPKKYKKYRATIKNLNTKQIRYVDFGDNRYEQYKDRTGLGHYTRKNHNNKKRMENYFSRHSGTKNRKKSIEYEKKKSNGLYNAKILSHEYLW